MRKPSRPAPRKNASRCRSTKPSRGASERAQARGEEIFARVALEVSPTAEETENEKHVANELVQRLAAKARQARVVFVGSAARDTGLRGDRDIDLFLAYPQTLTRDEIVERTIAATKNAIPIRWEMHYAEHPYLQGTYLGYRVEVIPSFQIAPHEPVKSAVDRSILHMDYLQNRLSREQRRDVRCLKKLLKTNGLYGAELQIAGFSGLVCEQLVLNYRNLWGLLAAAAEWKVPVFIDLEGNWPNATDRENLHQKYPTPLLLIDAVDKNRNAAAALSETNLYKFIALARAFTRKPALTYFTPQKPLDGAKARALVARAARRRKTAAYLLLMQKPGVVDDILYPQLYKLEKSLRKQLEHFAFSVVDSATLVTRNRTGLFFELASPTAPHLKRVTGPPADKSKDVDAFLRANKNFVRGPFIEGSRIVGERERELASANAFFNLVIRTPRAFGAPSNFVTLLRKAHLIELNDENVSRLGDDEARQLHAYYHKKDEWLR